MVPWKYFEEINAYGFEWPLWVFVVFAGFIAYIIGWGYVIESRKINNAWKTLLKELGVIALYFSICIYLFSLPPKYGHPLCLYEILLYTITFGIFLLALITCSTKYVPTFIKIIPSTIRLIMLLSTPFLFSLGFKPVPSPGQETIIDYIAQFCFAYYFLGFYLLITLSEGIEDIHLVATKEEDTE